ncbi:UvsX RecA-like recombination protein [Rhizobium phage RHEph12]|nr:UvsX RecA-like recombination protein [Rhizobium phage RHEph12]
MARSPKKTAKAAPAKAVKNAKAAKSGKKASDDKRMPKTDKNYIPMIAPTMDVSPLRVGVAEFYVKRIDNVEASTHMISNVAKYMDPLSTGNLVLDWLFNGGLYNGFASVAGPEQSSKSTAISGTIANGIKAGLAFNLHIDAEGTINDEYAARMFAMMGIDYTSLEALAHKPYRYYKENVIETIYNHMHMLLRDLPQKVWIPSANSWAYIFNKADKGDAQKMEIYGVTPDKKLSRKDKYVCLTEYSGIEAAFYPDSFAAMVTLGDDEEDTKSKRRAAEAAAFSDNIKRIASRLSNRGCLLFGANQVREVPDARGGHGPTYREPGGQALQFFSAQRARFGLANINSSTPGNNAAYNKDFKRNAEPSVIVPGAFDLYDYKSVKNTKNKMGNPGKSSYVRVWVGDHMGNGHGYDPSYDNFVYLLETGQLIKDRRELRFNLRKSAGSKRAELLNSLPPFKEENLKLLSLAEIFKDRELTQRALDGMNLTRTVGLRAALFDQLKTDKKVLAIKTQKKVKEEVDYEDDGVQEL